MSFNFLDLEETLGKKRIELAGIDLKLENREFKSATEDKKVQERLKSDIEAVQAAMAGVREKISIWTPAN
jgi:hypothetical protein